MSEVETRQEPDAALAQFVATTDFEDIPEAAVRSAERAFVDTVGVTLAGAAEGAGKRAIAATTGDAPATILGTDRLASLTDAAFANGTASHGLDFDDVTHGVWHPSAPMVPAILTVAEGAGLSGADALTAYVVGFETQSYLAAALLPAHYERGWHATATFGTIGTAAAVASLHSLDEDATRHALNIAASMPAGLKANFGSMTKPMHVGNAARAGVTAGQLAAEGFTAAPGALGTDRGFLDLYSGDEPPSLDSLPTLGTEWLLIEEGLQVKKFPCCYFTHTSIATALSLVEREDLSPDEIASVHVTASQGAADALHYEDPQTGLEGKFSMQYVVAAALATGRVDLATFDDANVSDPTVQAVRERVSFEVNPEYPYDPYRTTLTVETTDGRTFDLVGETPPGTPETPLSDAELGEKFAMCAARAPAAIDVDAALDALDALRDQPDVADVTALLAATSR